MRNGIIKSLILIWLIFVPVKAAPNPFGRLIDVIGGAAGGLEKYFDEILQIRGVTKNDATRQLRKSEN